MLVLNLPIYSRLRRVHNNVGVTVFGTGKDLSAVVSLYSCGCISYGVPAITRD